MTLEVPSSSPQHPNLEDIKCVRLDGKLVPLFKCPYCKFRNVHEDIIIHHILWKDDILHQVDIDKIDKNRFFIHKNKIQSHYTYVKKEDLALPWIKCLWCNYRDKVERDLEWHFLEQHGYKVKYDYRWCTIASTIRFRYNYTLEQKLTAATRLAKLKSGIHLN
jgi:hypothetical protein